MGSVSSCKRVMNTQTSSVSPLHGSTPSTTSIDVQNGFAPITKQLTIIHFNDVYNVEPRDKEPVGGASRFKTAIDLLSHKKPLVLFSGDAIAPSNMSVVTQGKQMVPVLNSLNIQAAVYGNHEFDFGIDHLLSIKRDTNFPWLMSNVIDRETGQQLANGEKYVIINRENIKIGLIGLVEEEWLATLATLTIDDVIYTDYVKTAKALISYLRNQENCEFIVALTHMRMHNDRRLAECVPDIDIILGGHDHHYDIEYVNNVPIVKSGSDFRNFSEISVTITDTDKHCLFDIKKHTITRDIAEDIGIKEVVEHYCAFVKDNLEEEIGWINCSLEGRFQFVRTQETNLGDLVCDIMREATQADCALINSGTFRSDTIHEAGKFKMKDLVSILPMVDALTVLRISGQQLLAALENGVCQYPRLEGRFPQVSGLSFIFNPKKPSGHRILTESVKVNGLKLDNGKEYKLCTKAYLAEGKDGYDVFKSLPVIISHEEGPILSNIVRNHFTFSCKNGQRNYICSTVSVDSSDDSFVSDDTDGISPQTEGRIIVFG